MPRTSGAQPVRPSLDPIEGLQASVRPRPARTTPRRAAAQSAFTLRVISTMCGARQLLRPGVPAASSRSPRGTRSPRRSRSRASLGPSGGEPPRRARSSHRPCPSSSWMLRGIRSPARSVVVTRLLGQLARAFGRRCATSNSSVQMPPGCDDRASIFASPPRRGSRSSNSSCAAASKSASNRAARTPESAAPGRGRRFLGQLDRLVEQLAIASSFAKACCARSAAATRSRRLWRTLRPPSNGGREPGEVRASPTCCSRYFRYRPRALGGRLLERRVGDLTDQDGRRANSCGRPPPGSYGSRRRIKSRASSASSIASGCCSSPIAASAPPPERLADYSTRRAGCALFGREDVDREAIASRTVLGSSVTP